MSRDRQTCTQLSRLDVAGAVLALPPPEPRGPETSETPGLIAGRYRHTYDSFTHARPSKECYLRRSIIHMGVGLPETPISRKCFQIFFFTVGTVLGPLSQSQSSVTVSTQCSVRLVPLSPSCPSTAPSAPSPPAATATVPPTS